MHLVNLLSNQGDDLLFGPKSQYRTHARASTKNCAAAPQGEMLVTLNEGKTPGRGTLILDF
jgi:hypothetical protein